VLNRERADLVGAVAHRIGFAELHQLERVAHTAGDPLKRREQVAQAGRPEDP
jgi:hypothetical protein